MKNKLTEITQKTLKITCFLFCLFVLLFVCLFVCLIVLPTFKENGILMHRVVFLFSQFSSIRIIVFNNNFFTPLKISTP